MGLRNLGKTRTSGRIRDEGGRILAASKGNGSKDGKDEGRDANRSGDIDRSDSRSSGATGRKGSKRDRLNQATTAALLRIRRLADGDEDPDGKDS
jgi:hypothetical protein